MLLNYAVQNLGDGPAPASRVSFYLSHHATIDPANDFLLGGETLASVPGGGRLTDSFFAQLPSVNHPFWIDGQTSYTIGMFVDAESVVVETNETNNFNVASAVDSVSVSLAAPGSSIFGTVYNDLANDGAIAPRADHRFTITHTFPGTINPFSPPSFTLTGLPKYASDAELKIRVRGQYGQLTTSLNVRLDNVSFDFFTGVTPEGPAEILAERTAPLTGSVWEAAIADGSLRLVADPNASAGFSINSQAFVEITISYLTADEQLAYGTVTVPGRLDVNVNTPVSIASMGPAIGDARIELWAVGFLGAANRTATLRIENELTVTMLGNIASNDPLIIDSDSINVDAATLNRWLADGLLQATVTFGTSSAFAGLGNVFELRLSYPIDADDGLAGQVVQLDLDGDGVIDRTAITRDDDPSTSVNERGNFEILDVPVGSHRLSILPSTDHIITSPSNNDQAVSIATGQSPRGLHFGVHELPDVTPPRIDRVYVNSSRWNPAFKQTFAGQPGLPMRGAHQSRVLPWVGGVDEIVVEFSEDIGSRFAAEHFVLRGADLLNLVRPETIRYDAATRRVVIQPIAAIEADRMMVSVFDTLSDAAGNPLDGEWITNQDAASGNGTAGGHFHFQFNVLVGDVDGSGRLSFVSDLLPLYQSLLGNASAQSFVYRDINGDGRLNFAGDVLTVQNLIRGGRSLPAQSPPPPLPPTLTDTSMKVVVHTLQTRRSIAIEPLDAVLATWWSDTDDLKRRIPKR